MILKINKDITNNIFSVVITIDEFGTDQMSEDDEKALISNFPSKIAYRNLMFTKNIKLLGNEVIVTEEDTSDSVVKVILPAINNQVIPVDENFSASFKISSDKISSVNLNDVLDTKEKVCEAYIEVFVSVITDAISEYMNEIRNKSVGWEGESFVTV